MCYLKPDSRAGSRSTLRCRPVSVSADKGPSAQFTAPTNAATARNQFPAKRRAGQQNKCKRNSLMGYLPRCCLVQPSSPAPWFLPLLSGAAKRLRGPRQNDEYCHARLLFHFVSSTFFLRNAIASILPLHHLRTFYFSDANV